MNTDGDVLDRTPVSAAAVILWQRGTGFGDNRRSEQHGRGDALRSLPVNDSVSIYILRRSIAHLITCCPRTDRKGRSRGWI